MQKSNFEEEWKKIQIRNKQEQEKNRLFLQSIKITQQKSRQTIQNIQNTLVGIRTTVSDIKSTGQQIQSFQKKYTDAFQEFTYKCFQKILVPPPNPLKKQLNKIYQNLPMIVPMKQAVNAMMKYDNILYITGAGISAPSGIPTFRGPNGLYTEKLKKGDQEYAAQQFLTQRFYNQNPQIIWNWLQNFVKISEKCKPNQGHILLDKCCKQLLLKNKKVTLVTQNIDNLHIQAVGYQFHHIHGDIRYVRCQNLHLTKFNTKNKICSICQRPTRPHILFFDESYGELYGGDIKQNIYDFIITIGTMLQTNLVKKFVSRAKQVIQINLEPVIQVGKIYTFKMSAIDGLRQMYNQLIK